MQDDFVALFAYDRWANRKVLDACRKLTAEQYVAEPVPGWSSVRSTVYHIALVTEIHLRTLAGDADDSIPTEADLATVDDAARLLERAYRRFEELQPMLTPERLNTVVTLRRRGRTATLPPWAMLRHIVNHSTFTLVFSNFHICPEKFPVLARWTWLFLSPSLMTSRDLSSP